MSDLTPVALDAENEKTLKKLVWAIAHARGQFKLMLVRCNYSYIVKVAVDKLQHFCATEYNFSPQVVELSPTETKLYRAIVSAIADAAPPALLVLGLTEAVEIDSLLVSANIMRETFRESFPFPVVLWLDDRTFGRFMEVAPDFYSWATTKELSAPTPLLYDRLYELSETVFQRLLRDPDLVTASNVSLVGKEGQREALMALEELQARGETLDRLCGLVWCSLLGAMLAIAAMWSPPSSSLKRVWLFGRTTISQSVRGFYEKSLKRSLPMPKPNNTIPSSQFLPLVGIRFAEKVVCMAMPEMCSMPAKMR
jgi:hypothetical protein